MLFSGHNFRSPTRFLLATFPDVLFCHSLQEDSVTYVAMTDALVDVKLRLYAA